MRYAESQRMHERTVCTPLEYADHPQCYRRYCCVLQVLACNYILTCFVLSFYDLCKTLMVVFWDWYCIVASQPRTPAFLLL